MSTSVDWEAIQQFIARQLANRFGTGVQPPRVESQGVHQLTKSSGPSPRVTQLKPYPEPAYTPHVPCFLKWCWFKPSHLVSQCPIFREELTAQDRAEELKKLGRCFTCWKLTYNPSNRTSHNSRNCTHVRKCWCGALDHQILLHGAKHVTMKKADY